jgi:DNA-binding NtrC family response regulator
VPLSPQIEAALEGVRAYVVDDEPVILRSMRVLLSLWGMQIHTAESATAAEHLFRLHGPPDILIVDLRLDDSEHGAHLAGRLLMTYGECSVMIITGETSSEALRDANADGYPLLQKPIDSDLLRRSIARAI